MGRAAGPAYVEHGAEEYSRFGRKGRSRLAKEFNFRPRATAFSGLSKLCHTKHALAVETQATTASFKTNCGFFAPKHDNITSAPANIGAFQAPVMRRHKQAQTTFYVLTQPFHGPLC